MYISIIYIFLRNGCFCPDAALTLQYLNVGLLSRIKQLCEFDHLCKGLIDMRSSSNEMRLSCPLIQGYPVQRLLPFVGISPQNAKEPDTITTKLAKEILISLRNIAGSG